MEGARNGERPEVPKSVWEFYFTPECDTEKQIALTKQFCRDPTGKTMKVVETHTKDSYTDGFRGYGWASEHQLMVANDAFNPNNPKGLKIVKDIISSNKKGNTARIPHWRSRLVDVLSGRKRKN